MSDKADGKARRTNVRFIFESAAIIAVITTAVVWFQYTKPADYVEKIIDDTAVAYFTPRAEKAHPKVAVVAIDEATINELPARSPIDRLFLAKLLKVLDDAGTAGIGVDVTFFEPSKDPKEDQALIEVLSNMKTLTILATGLKRDTPIDGLARRPLVPEIEATGVEIALANLPVDLVDRTLRNFRPAFADDAGNLHDTMAVVLARHAGAEVEQSTEDIPIDWYGQPGWQDRMLPDGTYAGDPPIATFSALTLERFPIAAKQFLKDKVVFIGATFEGSNDFLRTPFELRGLKDESFAGVFGHAQIAAQLLDGRSRPTAGPVVSALLVLGAVIVGLLLALLRVPAIIPLVFALVLPVAWVAIVFLLRRETGIGVPAVPPALGAGLSLATFALFRARRFDNASRVAAKALNSYLPPALARRVINDPGLLRLGGEPRELSMLFTDIAGFTGFSERSRPDEVVGLLNVYLDQMADIILKHNGTLDKFIGDAVMAFFGAPVDDPAHPARAIVCAIDMDNYSRQFESEHDLKTRIGVHTGSVIVGNVGGEKRFDYTVIGDAVNTAARLEGANKYLGPDSKRITTICISGDTVENYRQLLAEGNGAVDSLFINLTGDEMRQRPDAPALRRIGRIRVKGRELPLDVYTTVPAEFDPEKLDAYNAGLELLEAGSHEEAGKIFKNLYNDDLSAYQLLRCEHREGPTLTLTEK